MQLGITTLPTAEENTQEHAGTRLPKIVNVFIWRNAMTRFGGTPHR